jgi:hypothetical protein
MADLKSAQGDYAEALLWRRKAQQRDPGNIMFHLGEVWPLTTLGLEDQYEGLLDRLAHLDPDSSTLALADFLISVRRGNLDAALEASNSWVSSYPPEDNSRYLLKVIAHIFRDETAPGAEYVKLAMGDPLEREAMLGFARDAPTRACMVAGLIREEIDKGLGTEVSQAAIDHVDHQLLDHQAKQLNIGLSVCHLVLGDREGALARIEQAVADGQLDGWWYPLSHPLFRKLEFEPRYQDALMRIGSAMTEQRQRFLDLSDEKDR